MTTGTKQQSIIEAAAELLSKAKMSLGKLNQELAALYTGSDEITPLERPTDKDPERVAAYLENRRAIELREIHIRTEREHINSRLRRWQHIENVSSGIISQSEKIKDTQRRLFKAEASQQQGIKREAFQQEQLNVQRAYQAAVDEAADIESAIALKSKLPVLADIISSLESQQRQGQTNMQALRQLRLRRRSSIVTGARNDERLAFVRSTITRRIASALIATSFLPSLVSCPQTAAVCELYKLSTSTATEEL